MAASHDIRYAQDSGRCRSPCSDLGGGRTEAAVGMAPLPGHAAAPQPRLLLLPAAAPGSSAASASPPPPPPRKRQRLAHLSAEEKALRRKLKNRVAAQSARDRKKARMGELERQAVELEAENQRLLAENQALRGRTLSLAAENRELRLRLGLPATEAAALKVSRWGGTEGGPFRSLAPPPPRRWRRRPLPLTWPALPPSVSLSQVEAVAEPPVAAAAGGGGGDTAAEEEEELEMEEEASGLGLGPATGSAESAALRLRVPLQQGQAQQSPLWAASAWILTAALALSPPSLICSWAFWTAWTQTCFCVMRGLSWPAGRPCSKSSCSRREEKRIPYRPLLAPLWGPHRPGWKPLMN
ncbi:X-box-binding protein 1 isoform X1 [Eublepharis macularius]|uniref:X-box-binding protein 1 n=1 Tax=Eublepharis macularius TaxID=481883 RepID=A0AA97KDA1_EUBMA|nr:X-box-binding protein 1 isoform X1 [Eublepharis macularius]